MNHRFVLAELITPVQAKNMGQDITAHFDIDQEQVETFIVQHQIDRADWESCRQICRHFFPNIYTSYYYDEELGMHEIFFAYGTNFIRDDTRFTDVAYKWSLEKRVGKPFPLCLEFINCIRTAEDAIEVADELKVFFPDDSDLMDFAGWLRDTAKYGCRYSFSY